MKKIMLIIQFNSINLSVFTNGKEPMIGKPDKNKNTNKAILRMNKLNEI
jgi:hypothetical protein